MVELSERPDKAAIAASLRHLRLNAGLTQRSVGDALGASISAINKFERGRAALDKDKIARLPAALGCKSLQHMVDKANARPLESDRAAIGASMRYLRQKAGLTQRAVGDAIGASPSVISQFEHNKATLDKDKIARLPAVFGCESLQHMADKANARTLEPDRAAIAASLRYLRLNAGLTQRAVAAAIGASISAINQFEHGKAALGKDKLARLPAACGCESFQHMVDKAESQRQRDIPTLTP